MVPADLGARLLKAWPWLQSAAALATTTLVAWLTFSDAGQSWVGFYALLLPLTWAALRCGLPVTVAAAVIILLSAALGRNPYTVPIDDPRKAALVLQLALMAAAVHGLVLAISAAAQRRDRAALRALNQDLEVRVEAAVAARELALVRAQHAQHIQALGQIAAGVAHEFNNVLQAVMGSLEMIDYRSEDADRVRRLAQAAFAAAKRGSTITERLRGFARRAPLHAERVETVPLLTALRELLSKTLGGGIAVSLDVPPDVPAMLIDRTGLEAALVNLATNARDAMPDGGTLLLSARSDDIGPGDSRLTPLVVGRYIRITVADTGTGMDADTRARATEPFFTTKAVGAGVGLGLSMAKGFARQSGGGLAIESTPGQGTIVTMWLPVAAEP